MNHINQRPSKAKFKSTTRAKRLKRARVQRSRARKSEPKVAILLNRNARKVNTKMIDKIKARAPHADIFVTETLDEAERALTAVARGRYDLCFTGGGDGTVCHTVTRLSELSSGRSTPPIGVLPLGTGNAIASFLESPNVESCVQAPERARADLLSFPQLEVLSSSNPHLPAPSKAAFGGFGWDSYVLDRYFRWRDFSKRFKLLKPISEGLFAYLLAGIGWAVPSLLLRRPRWGVKVRNGDAEAYRLDQDGNILERFAPGEMIYEGKARMFSFGTCPFFGFRLKALPLAAVSPDMMQIRVADFSPLITTLALPKIWRGEFKHPKLSDFLAHSFEVEVSSEVALQMGGDVVGKGCQFKVDMSKPSPVLRFGEYQGVQWRLNKEDQVA